MKKAYIIPGVRYINLETEGMIADSIGFGGKETIDASSAYTEKQENIWGSEGIWK